ncbi:conserved Plasmodium protein, unknown function [Plasmodium chabaudi chabaudi]|uniref:Uncharacterized protein n=1 Tax=Plasmodium chabaudi chabaudi TaxID=31271 RepID=A0A4V0KC12_PLACU|nr:conserved Plasmodium protein, unknown function [Plasmodium chabaudi chabaudi]VTZ70856.1 conserved Plasmodium protein, unknown function [Plasmodium chabaudi chabaudi]|eukprot:XP_016654875.1 conserved Plasmodium protein, unknown function [Plasmodium chabaudi chabaudi]
MILKMNKKEKKKELIRYTLSELQKSKLYINEKISCEIKCEKIEKSEESYHEILDSINKKIIDYSNYLKKLDTKNEIFDDSDQKRFVKNKVKGNILQEYIKGNNNNKIHTRSDLYKVQKREIVGYTTKGNAIIINNENFDNIFKNYNDVINDQKKKPFTKKNKSIHNDNKKNKSNCPNDIKQPENDEEENEYNYLSEQSCSSSSIISLNSFVQREKIKRINKNREAFAKHKYQDNSFVTHQLYSCSDCSSTSFDWYEDQYDSIFYYTNALNQYKHLKKNKSFLKIKKDELMDHDEIDHKKLFNDNLIKKDIIERKKHIDEATEIADYIVKENSIPDKSPFYNYIYFKYQGKDKDKYYPVFVNTINGKKKMCNLKKINKSNSKNSQGRGINKYELDTSLFSYKDEKLIPSVENIIIDKRHIFQNYKNLRRQLFENGELNYSIDKTVHSLEKLSNMKRHIMKEVKYNEHFENFIQKNREFIIKERESAIKKLYESEKIKLKVKIIGTNGREIKNKSLDNVLINKNKTFGDLAKNLGQSFKLPEEDIDNIKVFFDGDLCDKDLTFNDEELGLEDGFQIDVKFPLTVDPNGSDDSNFSDESYVLFLPDSYIID